MKSRDNSILTGRMIYRRNQASLKDVKVSSLLWLLLFNLLFFQMFLQDRFSILSNIDEIATLLLGFLALKTSSGKEQGVTRSGSERASFWLFAAFILIGCASTIANGVQSDLTPVLIDAFACSKFAIACFSLLVIRRSFGNFTNLIIAECKVLTCIMLACGTMNVVVDIGMGSDIRYGLRSFEFIFPHPTYMNFAVAGMFLLFLSNPKGNKLWIYSCLVLFALSLRSKGIAFAGVAFLLLLLVGRKQKINVVHVLLIALVAIYFGWDQYQYYFQTDGFARKELLDAGTDIANRYAPLGTGFASFGSAITSTYYSPLYYTYGLSQVWGLRRGYSWFLSDTFWPTVIGQFGWLGFFVFLVSLGSLFMVMYRHGKKAGSILIPVCLFAYLLISSTAESAFFNPMSVYLAFCCVVSLAAQGCQSLPCILSNCSGRNATKSLKAGDSIGC